MYILHIIYCSAVVACGEYTTYTNGFVILVVLSFATFANAGPRALRQLNTVKKQLQSIVAQQKDLQSALSTLEIKFTSLRDAAKALQNQQDEDHELLLACINNSNNNKGEILSQLIKTELEALIQCNGDEHTEATSCSLKPGEKGEAGLPGMMGPPGNRGEKGDNGNPGMTGQQGFPGLPGAPGKDGAEGKQGTQGAEGERGEAGLRGTPGMPGAVGAMGDMGGVGASGAPGEKGDTGAEGPAGVPGETGQERRPGLTGPPGQKGQKGDPHFPELVYTDYQGPPYRYEFEVESI